MATMDLKKIKHFDGLYGDLDHKKGSDYIFLEMIQTRSKGFGWVIDAHIHSHLYQLFFIDAGRVTFDGPSYFPQLDTPCILIIPPHTLHGLRYSADVKGNILTISDKVIENVFKDSPSIMVDLENFQYLRFSNKKDAGFLKIVYNLHQIQEELFINRPEKRKFLDACLTLLFASLWRLLPANEIKYATDTNATLKYFRSFQQAIRKTEMGKSIPSYAKEIGISTVHLNRICKQVSGKSALLLLQEHKIDQAKNYLTHTSYTISEIAYQLNFQYANYFARLFKNLTGISPTDYRIKSRGQKA